MTDFPITPDFANWPKEHSAQQLDWDDEHLSITWSDGVATEHHVLLLRENSPDPVTLHPKAREVVIAPTDIPADIKIQSGMIEKNGAVLLNFSDGLATAYHPGLAARHRLDRGGLPSNSNCLAGQRPGGAAKF